MAAKAMEVVQSGELKIIPDQYKKIWYHWMENIRDWCISRQLWWGHRIPVYSVTVIDTATCAKVISGSDLTGPANYSIITNSYHLAR